MVLNTFSYGIKLDLGRSKEENREFLGRDDVVKVRIIIHGVI